MRKLIAIVVVAVSLLDTGAGAKEQERSPPAADAVAGKDAKAQPKVVDPNDDDLYSCKKYPAGARIKVTFKPETELKELVQWAMGFTCRQFVMSTTITSRTTKITIVAPNDMTPQDGLNLFLTALEEMNLTIVKRGPSQTYTIVEATSAKEKPVPVYKPDATPTTDTIVRVLIRPTNVSADDLSAVLTSLKSKDGAVTPFANVGVVIVTDYGSSIEHMLAVTHDIDVPGPAEKTYYVRIERTSDAAELAKTLEDLFSKGAASATAPAVKTTAPAMVTPDAGGGGGGGGATPTKIVVDEASNGLLIVGTEQAYARTLALIHKLTEAAIPEGEGRVHVYYLANADAEELAGTLAGIVGGSRAPGTTGTTGTAGGMGGGARAPQMPGTTMTAGTAGATNVAAFDGAVKVTFDKPTNALVVVSSVKDYVAVRDVIKRLDVPRRQVFIEATILEVSIDRSRQIGTSFHGGKQDGSSLLFGGVQHSSLSSIALDPESLFGLTAGIEGATIPGSDQFLGVTIPSFGVLFQMLENDSDVNVLSSPHILTVDGVESSIEIGETIPFQSGIVAVPSSTTTSLPLQSIQHQDVVLKLKIKSHVNDSDLVRLEIEQSLSDVKEKNFGGLGPSWSDRKVATQIVVKDQEPIVIGGLMADKTTIGHSKVPFLGDIPVLGYLFKYETKQTQKTNLLIFITPYIVKDQSDIRRIYQKKIKERRDFIEAYTAFDDRSLTPDVDYGKKRGLIAEINAQVKAADDDQAALDEAARKPSRTTDEGPIEGHP